MTAARRLALAPDLTDDARLLDSIAQRAANHDRQASFPHENLTVLHASGALALTVPRHFGGAGAGLSDAADLLTAVGGACASTALVLAMHINRHASLAQDKQWPETLRAQVAYDAVRHGKLINVLRAEPKLGSPTRGGMPSTIARRQDDGTWRLAGRKAYVTGAPGLEWMEVWARTDEAVPRLGYVLVSARAPGVHIVETWNHLGMRATGSHDVLFQDVVLPADHAVDLRSPDAWGAPDPVQAAWNAVGLGALYTGIARTARDWVVQFLGERRPTGLGAPLASLSRVQERVGEIQSLLLVNDRLIRSAALQVDTGTPLSVSDAFLLKSVLAENAVLAVQAAAALAGNHAHSRDHPMERHLRDVLCARVHVPSADAAHVAAGRDALADFI